MSGRFEIDELVAQDSTRVVYRAHDRETGSLVALRRLLPRGHAGSGLSEEEAASFEASMRALAGVNAPGLRRVVGWGIDPIDRLPYHACEWVEGEILGQVLNRGMLSADAGRMLVESALVAQVALDESGGGWQVAIDPSAIIVVGGEQEFWFSFWVGAFPGPSAGLAVGGLAQLVETACGWHGRLPAAGAGGGLASWVRMVRRERCSAVDALGALRGAAAPAMAPAQGGVQAPQTAVQSSAPQIPAPPPADLSWTMPRKRNRVALWLAASGIALAIFGVGAWMVYRSQHPKEGPPRPEAQGHRKRPEEPVVRPGGQAAGQPAGQPGRKLTARERAAAASARAAELAKMSAGIGTDQLAGKFTPADGAKLRQMKGQNVELEGDLFQVRDSSSGKTRYLEFSGARGLDDVCGRFWARDGVYSLGMLKPLEGRRVRMIGVVDVEHGTGRVVVHLDQREQLQDLGPGSGDTPVPKKKGKKK